MEDETFSPKVEFEDGDIDDEIDPALKEKIDRWARQVLWLLNILTTIVQRRYQRVFLSFWCSLVWVHEILFWHDENEYNKLTRV